VRAPSRQLLLPSDAPSRQARARRVLPEEQQRIDASIAYFLADVGELPAGLAEALPRIVWDTAQLRTYLAPIRAVELGRLQRFLAAPV